MGEYGLWSSENCYLFPKACFLNSLFSLVVWYHIVRYLPTVKVSYTSACITLMWENEKLLVKYLVSFATVIVLLKKFFWLILNKEIISVQFILPSASVQYWELFLLSTFSKPLLVTFQGVYSGVTCVTCSGTSSAWSSSRSASPSSTPPFTSQSLGAR